MEPNKRVHEVVYTSGETVQIKPVPPSKMEDLIDLQTALISEFVIQGGMMGEVLRPSNQKVWADLRKLAAMIPIVGPPGSFLDVDQIDDVDQLSQLFFTSTTTVDPESGCIHPPDGEMYAPSIVSMLNGINFLERLLSGREMAITQLKAQQKEEVVQEVREPKPKKRTKTPSPVEDPQSTPLAS